jgi:DNA polymerase III subunit delta'
VRTPTEAERKVLVLVDFHLVAQQYPRLLKTLEEPPASTVFVVLAEHLPPELVTIASRCVRIDLGPVPAADIRQVLEAEGVPPETAAELAEASNGNLDRARLLAGDPGFAARQALWRSVPARLDGTGATVATLVDQLLAAIDTVLEPLRERQAAEGATGKEAEDRHKREQRRVRQDELRSGLATLAAAYRDRLTGPGPESRGAMQAVAAVQAAAEALIRNPNETLLLQGLLVRLTDAAAAA